MIAGGEIGNIGWYFHDGYGYKNNQDVTARTLFECQVGDNYIDCAAGHHHGVVDWTVSSNGFMNFFKIPVRTESSNYKEIRFFWPWQVEPFRCSGIQQ